MAFLDTDLTSGTTQVGNATEDILAWSRPEDITAPRPFYYVPVALGTSDLLGQLVGALASTALVFKETTPTTYDTLMSWALPLYGVAIGAHLSASSALPSPLSQLAVLAS